MRSVRVMRFCPHLYVGLRKVALLKFNDKNVSNKKTDVQISCHSNYETNVDVFNVFVRTQKQVRRVSDFIVN